jgi:riboflavin synthase
VNLELPLGTSSALDGHLVQGHVDARAVVKSVKSVASGREVIVELPEPISRFVAVKGSIAVDGVSLTVATVDKPRGTFGVALIPHTLAVTIAGAYKRGTVVNLEADVVARYVARNLRG